MSSAHDSVPSTTSPAKPTQLAPVALALFTVGLHASLMAAFAYCCTWGLGGTDNNSQYLVYVYIGLTMAAPIGIAAWAILSSSHPMLRFALPTVLLALTAAASRTGERWNSTQFQGVSVVDFFVIFAISCLWFALTKKRLGWQLGRIHVRDRSLQLKHLFIWTAVAAFVFASLGRERGLVTLLWETKILADAAMGIFGSMLGTLAIGFALDNRHRFRFVGAIIGLLFAASVFLVAMAHVGPAQDSQDFWSALALVSFSFLASLSWSFGVIQGFGYGPGASRGSKADWIVIAVIGCLLLCGYAYAGKLAFANERQKSQWRAEWELKGVRPVFHGESLVGVHFGPSNPLTSLPAAALEDQTLTLISIEDHKPVTSALRELSCKPTVKHVELRGAKISAIELKVLAEAKQLENISIRAAPQLKPSDIEALKNALPNCQVIVH